MVKNNMIRYVFENRPNELAKVIVKYGYKQPRTKEELFLSANDFVRRLKERALFEIATIHPDRKLILTNENRLIALKNANNNNGLTSQVQGTVMPAITTETLDNSEKKSNACGCSGVNGSSGCNGVKECSCNKTSNVEGDDKKEEVKANATTTGGIDLSQKNVLVFGLGALVAVGIIAIVNKS